MAKLSSVAVEVGALRGITFVLILYFVLTDDL